MERLIEMPLVRTSVWVAGFSLLLGGAAIGELFFGAGDQISFWSAYLWVWGILLGFPVGFIVGARVIYGFMLRKLAEPAPMAPADTGRSVALPQPAARQSVAPPTSAGPRPY